ncbi:retinol dehydrogenase 13-like [Argiope bruennichi]|uniref:retinol dehydrogenase 13-like n=1 Tax=Argiope bruennichi TaxID=94029 RepID=UPI00249445A7|nr:retinol dehydrogenase 13-like [Argiope bruennichi]
MTVAEFLVLVWDFLFKPKCTSQAKLHNKTVIITGGNAGIGKETALDLAARGAKVILGCRDREKGKKAAEDIRRQVPQANVTVKQLDLASFSSIRQFAAEILKSEPQIHILINNAGIMACPKSKTVDGFETQMGVNHLGHFLLTNLLLDKIKASTPSRIVNVSSAAYMAGKISLSDINMEKGYNPVLAYANSKLANILFTRELARKLEGTGVTTYSLHPGSVDTELSAHVKFTIGRIFGFFYYVFSKLIFKNPKQGAQTTIYCAVDEKVANESGLYYNGCRSVEPMAKAKDDAFAKKFWEFSEHLIESVPHSS